MKDELVSFKVAELAKEKGFNIECNALYRTPIIYGINVFDNSKNFNPVEKQTDYNDWFSAPTQSLLQRWLREVHKLFINIAIFKESEEKPVVYDYAITNLNNPYDINDCEIFLKDYGIEKDRDHFSFEEALEEGLKSALELIK
jgi:uncharacterized protein YihD (DUF1040 family)